MRNWRKALIDGFEQDCPFTGSEPAEENSREVRKVREVINWWTLAAEASKNLFRRTAPPSRWFAGVPPAEENSREVRKEREVINWWSLAA